MTKNHSRALGDSKSPALEPIAFGLRGAVDQAADLAAEPAPKLKLPSPAVGLACAAKQAAQAPPPASCQQRLWLSFFFDGTGNNLDADVGTTQHSSVAKLYRVHKENDSINGNYRIYIPGVGTYFSKVRDNGGSNPGMAMGHMGDVRLKWALEQFDEKLAPHITRANSSGNTILEINIALFGFSRGAALARAFANLLLTDRGLFVQKKGWCLKTGRYRLRIRFMGLFDTVASVGLAMSSNTVSKIALAFGVEKIIHKRLTDSDYSRSYPQTLAFTELGLPGADPAPGNFDGHQEWGGKMAIPPMVEAVRHFIAAHEIRNSFPVDSISILQNGKVQKPAQFHETVFPGVHSDVGGSYRPGDGGRSSEPEEKLGLIPLLSMYNNAIEQGVPLIPKTCWEDIHRDDFAIGKTLLQRYNYYQSKIGAMSSLGPLMNAHMSLYYAWRFRSIHKRQQGNRVEENEIKRRNSEFQAEGARLDKEIKPLIENNWRAETALAQANQRRASYLQARSGSPNVSDLPKYDAEVLAAKDRLIRTKDILLRAKARKNALPDMSELSSRLEMYDAQLMADAKAIRDIYAARGFFAGDPDSAKRKDLRPHYKVMMDAYENEFIYHKGLTDETIISFFDNYVHDSLAGFALDATLPSDPRVIYLGGDEKLKYAAVDKAPSSVDVRYASIDANHDMPPDRNSMQSHHLET
jgi:uncharacterized protein (DUF2235 family)